MFRVNLSEVFNRVVVDPDTCEDCPNLKRTVEEHGIDYDCHGSCFDCHQVDAKKDEVEAFQSDNQDMFELIEWID